MSVEKNLYQAHSLDEWTEWFKKEFAPSDLDSDGVIAFMHHFADMEILESTADMGKWKLAGIDLNSNPENIRDQVKGRLETVSRTQDGFAVAFFLGRSTEIPAVNKETSESPSEKRTAPKIKKNTPNREIASDLSNLQIVKKVGRQLQPFLEMEKATVSRLVGTHTQPKEARVIFNFILRHTKTKAEPKKWEQLSRKRHK